VTDYEIGLIIGPLTDCIKYKLGINNVAEGNSAS